MWGRTVDQVSISDVTLIEESPARLAPHLADKLYRAGESGMGYTLFVARLRDGTQLPFVTGNAIDFPNWPPNVDPRDVVDVEPHAGRSEFRHRAPGPYESSVEYAWCLYSV
jgi:hypothetical protein